MDAGADALLRSRFLSLLTAGSPVPAPRARRRRRPQVITLTDILRLFAVDPRSTEAAEWLTWASKAPAEVEGKRGLEETREALLGERKAAASEGAGA